MKFELDYSDRWTPACEAIFWTIVAFLVTMIVCAILGV